MMPEKTYIEIVERIYNTESNYQYIHPHTCAICTSYEVALDVIDNIILNKIKHIINVDKATETYTNINLYLNGVQTSFCEISDNLIKSVHFVEYICGQYDTWVHELRLYRVSNVIVSEDRILIS